MSASLRWGLILGVIAAALGAGAQVLGAATLPHTASGGVDQAVGAILIAGVCALLALVVALGLAYFAGIRVERARPRASISAEAALLDPAAANRGPGLAGLLVMALYWIAITGLGLVNGQRAGNATNAGSYLATQALIGLVLVAFGFGLGALGGRSPAARALLAEIAKGPPLPAAPHSDTLPPASATEDPA